MMKNIKLFFIALLTVVVVVAFAVLYKKNKGLAEALLKTRKNLIEKKAEIHKEKIKDNDKKISKLEENISGNSGKIDKLKKANENFKKKVDKAGNDIDELDKLYADAWSDAHSG